MLCNSLCCSTRDKLVDSFCWEKRVQCKLQIFVLSAQVMASLRCAPETRTSFWLPLSFGAVWQSETCSLISRKLHIQAYCRTCWRTITKKQNIWDWANKIQKWRLKPHLKCEICFEDSTRKCTFPCCEADLIRVNSRERWSFWIVNLV